MQSNETIYGECQCCGRQIGCKLGVIAHHGYSRPQGWGSQTASCMGARYPEFAIARSRLGQLIEILRADLARWQASLADLDADADGLVLHITIASRSHLRQLGKHLEVTRANFTQLREENLTHFMTHSLYNFDAILKSKKWHAHNTIGQINAEIKTQQTRFDDWPPAKLRTR